MAEVGVAAENKHYAKIQERNPGMAQVAQAEFHAILEMYCGLSSPGPSDLFAESNIDSDPHQVIVGLMTPAQLQAQEVEPPSWLISRGIFNSLPQSATDAAPSGHNLLTGDMDLQVEFQQAESAAAAIGVVTEGLTQKLARALGMAVGEVDLQRPLALLGVDSLLAVELRHWVRRFFTVEISALDITSAASVEHLAALVIERVTAPQKWIV